MHLRRALSPRRLPALLGALLLIAVGAVPGRARADGADSEPKVRYRTSAEVANALRALARRAKDLGVPAEVRTYGTTAAGTPLLALSLRGARPTILVHGGLGARAAAATAACLEAARQVVEDAEARSKLGWLFVPAPNPDALDAFLAGKPPAGGVPWDRDRDGLSGEDGPSDVDGDGEILRMRRRSPTGAWAPATVDAPPGPDGKVEGDPRLVEESGVDARRPVSYEVLDEGLDDDHDGAVNEDPPALDLTRQMAGWWDDKGPWRGDGPFPGYAPEARALMELSFAESGLVAWIGFEGTGTRILRASENGKEADRDDALYARLARPLKDRTGLDLEKASAARPGGAENPGSDLDWAAVGLGILAVRIPAWWIGKEERNARGGKSADELDWLLWNDRVLGGKGFVPWHPFRHPTLGPVEIGGWKRFTRYEPPKDLLAAAVERVASAPLVLAGLVPVLGADVRVEDEGGGLYRIRVRPFDRGGLPTDTKLAETVDRDHPVLGRFEPASGVTLLAGPPVARFGRIEAGQASGVEETWLVRLGAGAPPSEHAPLGTLTLEHPHAATFEQEVGLP